MKLPHPSLRRATLVSSWIALACVVAACSSNDSPSNTAGAGGTGGSGGSGGSGGMQDASVPPPPGLDAGSIMCGTNVCGSTLAGGILGLACCAGRMGEDCGLDFGQGCVDQNPDANFQPPMRDAGPPPTPDPACGQAIVTFMNQSFTLDGCCGADGMCGYYVPQMTSLGCIPPSQLPSGTVLPDGPVSCTREAGTTF